MIRPHENALTPASLATDGNQGESAKVLDPCRAEHSPNAAMTRLLVLSAIEIARKHLDSYALATDDPKPGMADAADLLDAAADCLASAEVSPGIARARGGDA